MPAVAPSVFESATSLAGPTAYIFVATLAALEASAFIGLFVPGELALLSGGYIAQQGHANLALMMAVAAAGAIVGDSVGYEIGRHLGPGLQRSRLGQKVGADRWGRAESYLDSRGGRAILAGRFIGLLRALVPAMAGATRMPYRRFIVWNVVGALVWAPGTVLAGYAAGSSYRRVEHYAGRAGLMLLVIAAAVAAVVFAARWVAAHPETVRRVTSRQMERPWVASMVRRYRSQFAFVANRFRPGNALGLVLTVQLVVLSAAGWAFGSLVQDVVGRRDATRLDRPLVRYVADHRIAWLTTVMRDVTWLGSTAVLIPLTVAAALLLRRRTRSWAPSAQLAISLAGAVALYDVIKPLVGRPRPRIGQLVSVATGYAFPSGHATQTAAVGVTLAILVSALTTSWPMKVMTWSAALLVALVVGFSRVYLGVHWPTDVLAGYALGALWATLCCLTVKLVVPRPRAPVTA